MLSEYVFLKIYQVIDSCRILGTVDVTRDPCTSTIPHDNLPKVQVTRDRLYSHTQEDSSATVIHSSVHCDHRNIAYFTVHQCVNVSGLLSVLSLFICQ